MPYVIGVALGLLTVLVGRIAGFDRERVFYPTILIVVGSYYVLFAAMGASQDAVLGEALGAVVFLIVAILGFRINLWVVAVALAGHGVFDSFHARLVDNPGVPLWWPAFCMTIDVVLGVCLALLLMTGRVPARAS